MKILLRVTTTPTANTFKIVVKNNQNVFDTIAVINTHPRSKNIIL